MKTSILSTILLRRLLALLFLASALAKLADFEGFLVQIAAYKIVVGTESITLIGWTVLTLEFFIGLGLWFGLYLRKIMIPMTLLLLAVFSGAIVYGVTNHGLEDCGCFGSMIRVSPPVSLFKNGIMGAVLIWLWRGTSSTGLGPGIGLAFARAASLAGLLAVGGVSVSALAIIREDRTVSENGGTAHGPAMEEKVPSKHLASVLQRTEVPFANLSDGDYLIALLSLDCWHCRASVAALNELSKNRDMPRVIGLCLGEQGELSEFRRDARPAFELQIIDPIDFIQLIGDSPPRFIFVKDRSWIQHWDHRVPTRAELIGL